MCSLCSVDAVPFPRPYCCCCCRQTTTVPTVALHNSYAVRQAFCTVPTLFLPAMLGHRYVRFLKMAHVFQEGRGLQSPALYQCPQPSSQVVNEKRPSEIIFLSYVLHHFCTVPALLLRIFFLICTVPATFRMVLFCLLVCCWDPFAESTDIFRPLGPFKKNPADNRLIPMPDSAPSPQFQVLGKIALYISAEYFLLQPPVYTPTSEHFMEISNMIRHRRYHSDVRCRTIQLPCHAMHYFAI